MDYLTFLSLLVIFLPPYVFIYIIIMYLGRRIDILLNFGIGRQNRARMHLRDDSTTCDDISLRTAAIYTAGPGSLIENYLGAVCKYAGVPRPMLDNSFARMFIPADWFKK